MPLDPHTESWDVHRLPRAAGKTFLVTGGNAGIGYFVAEQLAGTGATVVLGCRDLAKAESAMASIRSRVPGARVRHLRLDLADLPSLKATADTLDLPHLDAVVHNAGVALDEPPRRVTKDGHELMFGTNHLGHFALTRWLAPLLSAAPAGRVVTVGSFVAKSEQLDPDDLQSRNDYRPKRAYGRSKLAQMYFGFALDRRLRAAGSTVRSVVVHPGGALDSSPPHARRCICGLPRNGWWACPPASSSRARRPVPGPRYGPSSIRTWPAGSCGDRASSASAAGPTANPSGAIWPTRPPRRTCGTPAPTWPTWTRISAWASGRRRRAGVVSAAGRACLPRADGASFRTSGSLY